MKKPYALIIEDDRDIASLFRNVLESTGYHTEMILHGHEAATRLQTAQPDIILLDLNLPGVQGEKILDQIRTDTRIQNVPVVVVTAFSQSADSLRTEPDLILLKPVNLDQLCILVQRLRPTFNSLKV
jgi:CheY-like chemotaxis protein